MKEARLRLLTDFANGYYTCNDPAGNWDGASSFNPRNTPYDSYGKQVRYYYADFERAAIDGDILYHVIR